MIVPFTWVIFVIIMSIVTLTGRKRRARKEQLDKANPEEQFRGIQTAPITAAAAQPVELPYKPDEAEDAETYMPDIAAMGEGESNSSAYHAPGALYRGSMVTETAPDECDDGYGSIAHEHHEGEEFHAPGMHGGIETENQTIAAAVQVGESGDAPELMGMRLDMDGMRRAVVLNEVLLRRGGRSGWIRS